MGCKPFSFFKKLCQFSMDWVRDIFVYDQWRNEPKHLGGGHNLCEGAKRPSPRERSDRAGGGCGTVGSFFIFRLENVQSGAYLRRKF